MKVLLINNHHKLEGGTERYYFDLAQLLKSKGHKVAYFSMSDRNNIKTPWSKYFVSNINFNKRGTKDLIRKIGRMIYSLESKTKIKKLLDDFDPDCVHINNIYYYISPSVLSEIKKRNIPIVQTVHDYQLISPNLILFYKGKVSEATKTQKYYKALLDRAVKGSYMASFMAVAVSYIQKIFKFYEKNVDIYITPSIFLKNKMKEYAVTKKKIVHLPNFLPKKDFKNSASVKNTEEKYIIYIGRIAEHKGIREVIKLAEENPHIKIKVVGNFTDDILKKELLSYTKSHSNLVLITHQKPSNLRKLIQKSKFVITPSIWYENHPYVILEAFAQRKAVIASNIGGIPEIVTNKVTGLLFKPGDTKDFSKKVNYLWKNNNAAKKMGENAFKFALAHYDQDLYYKKILNIYNKLIKLSK